MTDRDFIAAGRGEKDPSDLSWVAGINGTKVTAPPNAARLRDLFGFPALKP